MQLSNLNLASKSSMKIYFFVGTPASLLVIQLLPPWTSCMPIQKEFTGGRWRHIELYVCSCDLVSEVFNETIRATVFMESLAFVTDCLWGPNIQLFQDKKMHSTFHWWQMQSRVACLSVELKDFTSNPEKINMDFIFYGIDILAMQLTSQTAHPFTLKNQMHIKVTHTRQHTFRID